MFRRWLDDTGRQELVDAVSYIESVSALELVVSIQRRTRTWLHISIIAGVAAGWAMLAFMLYSAPTFPLWAFLVEPFVAGGFAGWLVGRSPSAIRWLTPSSLLRTAVNDAARLTFIDRGVHRTRGRTGALVYCALGEQMAAVIADTGVSAALGQARLDAWREQIEAALHRGAAPTASAIAAMAPVFAATLPR